MQMLRIDCQGCLKPESCIAQDSRGFGPEPY